jgi:hypothetical protein
MIGLQPSITLGLGVSPEISPALPRMSAALAKILAQFAHCSLLQPGLAAFWCLRRGQRFLARQQRALIKLTEIPHE